MVRLRQPGQRLLTLLDDRDLLPQIFQHCASQRLIDLVVFHHQNAGLGQGGFPRRLLGAGLGGCQHRQRHATPESTAEAKMTLHADLSTHCLHQPLADGQPQPGPFMATCHRGIHLGEGGKQLTHLVRGDTATAVVDLEMKGLVLLRRHPQPDGPLGTELERVVEQVGQHLAQTIDVSLDPDRQVIGTLLQEDARAPLAGTVCLTGVMRGQ